MTLLSDSIVLGRYSGVRLPYGGGSSHEAEQRGGGECGSPGAVRVRFGRLLVTQQRRVADGRLGWRRLVRCGGDETDDEQRYLERSWRLPDERCCGGNRRAKWCEFQVVCGARTGAGIVRNGQHVQVGRRRQRARLRPR